MNPVGNTLVPKGWLKKKILHIIALFFISLLQVIVNNSKLVCGLIVAGPSSGQQTVPEMGVVTSRNPI